MARGFWNSPAEQQVDLTIIDYPSDTEQTPSRNLAMFGPMPSYSTIFGMCEDGLPLLFDLTNPTPGCILMVGNDHSGVTQLLSSVLQYSSLLNDQRDVNYYVITPRPGTFSHLSKLDHCCGIYSSYERASREILVELAALAEQRKSGRHTGAKIILAIDKLDQFLLNGEFEIDLHLRWLLQQGPSNGVWSVATLQADTVRKIDPELLQDFNTVISSEPAMAALMDGENEMFPAETNSPFTTRVGNQTIRFWLPEFV